jgi:hypothetical protein
MGRTMRLGAADARLPVPANSLAGEWEQRLGNCETNCNRTWNLFLRRGRVDCKAMAGEQGCCQRKVRFEKCRTVHAAAVYRALRRDELTTALNEAKFNNVRWLFPAESGFHQPIVLAEADPVLSVAVTVTRVPSRGDLEQQSPVGKEAGHCVRGHRTDTTTADFLSVHGILERLGPCKFL